MVRIHLVKRASFGFQLGSNSQVCLVKLYRAHEAQPQEVFIYGQTKTYCQCSQRLFARSFCLMFGFLYLYREHCVCCTHIESVAICMADVMIYYATTICLFLLLLLRLIVLS